MEGVGSITASLHRKGLAHDSVVRVNCVARPFRLGGKKEGAVAPVAVILEGIMDFRTCGERFFGRVFRLCG